MKAKGRKFGLILIVIAVLAMVLVIALSSTALASEKHYSFDCSKFNLKMFDHRIDWSKVAWCNIDFSKVHDWAKFWLTFDWKKFHFGCKPKCTTTTCEHTTTTCEHTTTTCENETTTTEAEVTTTPTSIIVNTGGGGTAGPGAGTWALGFFALALAGGLGWTAVRPALKRK
jgi:hypothetical protein